MCFSSGNVYGQEPSRSGEPCALALELASSAIDAVRAFVIADFFDRRSPTPVTRFAAGRKVDVAQVFTASRAPDTELLTSGECSLKTLDLLYRAVDEGSGGWKGLTLSCSNDSAWFRFNFLVAIHSALLVALFSLSKDSGLFHKSVIVLPVLGALLSLCWYVFGAQDRYLVELYRDRIVRAKELIVQPFKPHLMDDLPAVGEITDNEVVPQNFLQWRRPYFSITHLLVWFPLIMLVLWVCMGGFVWTFSTA